MRRWPRNSEPAKTGDAQKTAAGKPGFTLLELLISLALFFVVLSASFAVLMGVKSHYQRLTDKISGREAVVSVALAIGQDIWGAAAATVESGGQKLALTQITDGVSQSIAYDLNGGRVRRKINAASAYLTYDEKITGLRFADLGRGLVSFEVTVASRESYAYLAKSRVIQ